MDVMVYAKERETYNGLKLFTVMPQKKDVISWTAIVNGNSRVKGAWCLFERVSVTNTISWAKITSGYRNVVIKFN